MARFFNTAGPCNPEDHYMLPAAARLPEVLRLIEQKGYFVVHAPRQTGKTTTMLDLAQQLTASGRYAAVLVSMEVGAPFREDLGTAEPAILDDWRRAAMARLPYGLQPPAWPHGEPGSRIGAALEAWSTAIPRPLVLFLDEIDALQDLTLISVLRQLRAGFSNRPKYFPWSLALIGMRDVRDYKVASGGSERLNTASPFNIKVRSLTLSNFTLAEVEALYRQHTAETGQVFEPAAIGRAFYLTQGQPWLVNALAKVVVEDLATDVSSFITVKHIEQAKEVLIKRQDTHLDSLAERLREPRVRAVLEPILAGTASPGDIFADDIRFAQDLGLVRSGPEGNLEVANPIYREIIPYVLSTTARAYVPPMKPVWLRPDGSLDTEKLLEIFLTFWRQHGQPLLSSAPYHEIAPHLVLMAFLHRVVNAGGTIEREYAVGSGRMDLCLRYGEVTLAMELKVWLDGESDPLREGLAQLDGYLSGLDLDTGWLIIFDRRSGRPPISRRTTTQTETAPSGRTIAVIRG